MPRMNILDKNEQAQFDNPPVFDSYQRKRFLRFPNGLLETAKTFREPSHQIGFLLACGYFRSTHRFFVPKDYHNADIEAVARHLDVCPNRFEFASYPVRTRQRHEYIILTFYGFRRFDNEAKKRLTDEIKTMLCGYPKPQLIFERCLDILVQSRIQLTTSRKITDLIRRGINQHKAELSEQVEANLSDETRQLLDNLFIQSTAVEGGDITRNTCYKLTLLKRISQSSKPTKIKERIADFLLIESLYDALQPIISRLGLSNNGIRYYAGSVLRSKIFQLNQRTDEDRYIHVIAFIIHQYYRLQDNLCDVLLKSVKTSQNTARRDHREQVYHQRKQQKATVSNILTRLDSDVDLLVRIREITANNQLDDTQIVQDIRHLLSHSGKSELSTIRVELASSFQSKTYYDVLEERSIRLQNKASPILKALRFNAEIGASSLMDAMTHFKEKSGNITHTAPLDFLDAEERKAVMNESDQKLRISLYKSFLFIHVASAIKSGNLNLKQSYKYRPMDDYLIDKTRWDNNKKEYLERAGMLDFSCPKKILKALDTALFQQYKRTNGNATIDKNPHLKVAASGHFRIATPAKDNSDSQPLQPFFPKRHIVPLTEILSTINQYSGFLDRFGHWQQRHVKHNLPYRALYAGIMGLGCNIGTRKMAQISSMVTENELENIINWRFSLENIQAANDCIVKATDALELPKQYQRAEDKRHTSSDGQKFEVRKESLNANHSFKYFGKGQGVSAYTFIDERSLLWHSTVISAAERESAYVIDGLMRNDVVKSEIHSTDTHGYSEVIFAATHMLGFSYAPRIKNLKKQDIYIFKSRKDADQTDWKITPDKYVNEKVIEENWDDFLRLICTIKLKETTASDIFRRINSYSKQHALYKTMKAFGQIIKSLFILRYIDEVELRQIIEKQLNKIELANKLTRAVSVGNPREYGQVEKEEQEIAESCNRLIKNAIICWNYLYLTKKLDQSETEEDRDSLLKSILSHSVISWAHINLLGEYDFSDEKLRDTVGILTPKRMTRKTTSLGRENTLQS